MITDKLKELANARNKLAALEEKLAASLRSELAGLPAQFGFSSTAEFVAAVQKAAGGRKGWRRKTAVPPPMKPSSGEGGIFQFIAFLD